jgi:hypothetical protein
MFASKIDYADVKCGLIVKTLVFKKRALSSFEKGIN